MASNKLRLKATNGLDGNSKTITNVADPVNAQDVATKATVDLKANITSPTFTGAVTLAEGTSSVPSLTFSNDGAPDTGLYHISDGSFGVTCNTIPTVQFATDRTKFNTTVELNGTAIYKSNGTAPAYYMSQDGMGRQHWYWNTAGGTSPTFAVAGEDACDLMHSAASDGSGGFFQFRTASGYGKAAGAAISWTEVLLAHSSRFSYMGNTVWHSGNFNPANYATLASPTFTGTVSGITKAMVGLSSVDNTADTAKNVLSATKLTTARTIAMTGDVTYTSAAFDGSANVTAAATLANSGVTAGTYNNVGTSVTPFTVDAKGRVTATGTAVAIAIGSDANSNVKIGTSALQSNTTGSNNVANGHYALQANTTGGNNTAIGTCALYNNTTGSSNVANSFAALYWNTTGSNNTANGTSALLANTTGNSNTANGTSTLKANTTGYNNVANGSSALLANTTGNSNTANGTSALYNNTTGYANAANGTSALQENTTGYNNVANGVYALLKNTTGNWNTADGFSALYWNTTGSNNTANGTSALYYNANGNYNTANGSSALYNNNTGVYNAAVGDYALSSLSATQIAIASVSDYSATVAGTVKVTTSTVHGYTTSQSRSIRATTSYDGTYSITVIDTLNFYITKAFVATSTGFVYDSTQASNNTGIGHNSGTDAVANLTTQSNYVVIGNNATTNANIKVAWTVTSDARDKTNFKSILHGLDFVNQLKPTEYQYRKDRTTDEVQVDSRPRYGFLAQDILPLEGSNPIIIDDRDVENLKFNESSLIPVLVNAIKELSAKLINLETQLGI